MLRTWLWWCTMPLLLYLLLVLVTTILDPTLSVSSAHWSCSSVSPFSVISWVTSLISFTASSIWMLTLMKVRSCQSGLVLLSASTQAVPFQWTSNRKLKSISTIVGLMIRIRLSLTQKTLRSSSSYLHWLVVRYTQTSYSRTLETISRSSSTSQKRTIARLEMKCQGSTTASTLGLTYSTKTWWLKS